MALTINEVSITYSETTAGQNQIFGVEKGCSAYNVFGPDSVAIGQIFQIKLKAKSGQTAMRRGWSIVDCNGNTNLLRKHFHSRYAATCELIKIWQRQNGHSAVDQQNNEVLAEGIVDWRKWARSLIGEAPLGATKIQKQLIKSVLENDESMRSALSTLLGQTSV